MLDTFTGKWGPREIALAVAFGILIGLIPKENLTVVVMSILFFLSHANILLGLVVILIMSLAAPWIHPLASSLGGEILTSPSGNAVITAMFHAPLLPWTSLNNTVVLGSLMMGLVLFLPVFLVIWMPLKMIWPKNAEATEEEETSCEDAESQVKHFPVLGEPRLPHVNTP